MTCISVINQIDLIMRYNLLAWRKAIKSLSHCPIPFEVQDPLLNRGLVFMAGSSFFLSVFHSLIGQVLYT